MKINDLIWRQQSTTCYIARCALGVQATVEHDGRYWRYRFGDLMASNGFPVLEYAQDACNEQHARMIQEWVE